MAAGLSLLGAVASNANAKVVGTAVDEWTALHDGLSENAAAQAAIAARVTRLYGPRLQQLGFVPGSGEAPTDAVLRDTLIGDLGKLRDPAVVAEANRLFAAWQADANAIPGSLKATWLGVIAANADAATWNALHARAQQATGAIERTSLYQLLGATGDEALAQRALELALTAEPGKTVSSGMIASVAGRHPRLAIDFVLGHLPQVDQLIDISGRSRFMQRLSATSKDAALIPILEAYANANLAATDRKPIDQSIDRIRAQSARAPRINAETAQWLAVHPG
jgi:aminopeptidase N